MLTELLPSLPFHQVGVHPLRNDCTVLLSPTDLIAFVKKWKHEPKVVDFQQSASPSKDSEGRSSAVATKPKTGGKSALPKHSDSGKKSGADAKGLEYTKAENFPKWYEQVRVSVVPCHGLSRKILLVVLS